MRDEALDYAARLRAAGVAVASPVLGPATGWPDSLERPPRDACPCRDQVREHVTAFFSGAVPVPS
jgi:hypothetical protein